MTAGRRLLYFGSFVCLAATAALAAGHSCRTSIASLLVVSAIAASVAGAPGLVRWRAWPLVFVLLPLGAYLLARAQVTPPADVGGAGGQMGYLLDQTADGIGLYQGDRFPLDVAGKPELASDPVARRLPDRRPRGVRDAQPPPCRPRHRDAARAARLRTDGGRQRQGDPLDGRLRRLQRLPAGHVAVARATSPEADRPVRRRGRGTRRRAARPRRRERDTGGGRPAVDGLGVHRRGPKPDLRVDGELPRPARSRDGRDGDARRSAGPLLLACERPRQLRRRGVVEQYDDRRGVFPALPLGVVRLSGAARRRRTAGKARERDLLARDRSRPTTCSSAVLPGRCASTAPLRCA